MEYILHLSTSVCCSVLRCVAVCCRGGVLCSDFNTHTVSLTHTLSLTHTHTVSDSGSRLETLTHTQSHLHTHSLSLTHTQSLTHTHSLSLGVSFSERANECAGGVLLTSGGLPTIYVCVYMCVCMCMCVRGRLLIVATACS